jgi:hypothetical protein
MIQRKQTLFLLAVTIIGILMLFIPFIRFNRDTEPFTINFADGINSAGMTANIYYPFTINVLVIVLSTIIIFLYKNRVLQYKLANLVVLFNVFITGLFFLLPYVNVPAENISFTFGAFLPIISAVFAFLAGHFIKKDEQLVRSADRIR